MTLGNCSASPCIKYLIKYVNFVELILSLGSMEEWTRYVGTKSPSQCVCCAPPCSSIWRRPTGWTKESRSTTAAASSAQVEMQSQQLQQSPEDGSLFFHWQCWRQWIHWQVPLRLFPGPPWHLFVITQEAPLRPLPPYCSPPHQLLLRLLLLLLLLGLFFAKVHDNKNSNVRNGIRLVHMMGYECRMLNYTTTIWIVAAHFINMYYLVCIIGTLFRQITMLIKDCMAFISDRVSLFFNQKFRQKSID